MCHSGDISMQKPTKFDLKESLQRQLTYKPYTGKLKSFEEKQEATRHADMHPSNKTGLAVTAKRYAESTVII